MAKKKIDAAIAQEDMLITIGGVTKTVAEWRVDMEANAPKAPGWYVDADESGFAAKTHYAFATGTRILPDGSPMIWEIKWPDAKGRVIINRRLNEKWYKGFLIPGHGGTKEWWGFYDEYRRSADYNHDRKWTNAMADLAAVADLKTRPAKPEKKPAPAKA